MAKIKVHKPISEFLVRTTFVIDNQITLDALKMALRIVRFIFFTILKVFLKSFCTTKKLLDAFCFLCALCNFVHLIRFRAGEWCIHDGQSDFTLQDF